MILTVAYEGFFQRCLARIVLRFSKDGVSLGGTLLLRDVTLPILAKFLLPIGQEASTFAVIRVMPAALFDIRQNVRAHAWADQGPVP